MRAALTTKVAIVFVVLTGGATHGDDFFREFLTPSAGTHVSPRGTPYVHAFFVEPAYLDRDLLIDYRPGYGFDDGTDEQELEFELEWALTERSGFVLEVPLVGVSPDLEPYESGFGDLALGGRVLLVDRPCLLISTLLEIELPTGDAARGLGRGEAAIAPFLLWWMDLGNWTQFQGQFGPEMALDSGETELIYRLCLSHSWQGPVLFPDACRCCAGHRGYHACCHEQHEVEEFHDSDRHDHDDHSHHGPGITTLYVETTGFSSLTEPDEGTRFEFIPGIGYSLTESWELRFAARFPLFKPERLDSQYIFSAVRHF